MDVIGPGIVLKRFERKPNMLRYTEETVRETWSIYRRKMATKEKN